MTAESRDKQRPQITDAAGTWRQKDGRADGVTKATGVGQADTAQGAASQGKASRVANKVCKLVWKMK